MHLELDEETGEPLQARFTYVDEHSCIGCTYCATTARNTFFMEEDHGRARVWNQAGDAEELVRLVRSLMQRNHLNVDAGELHRECRVGSKLAIEAYIAEVVAALRYLEATADLSNCG